MGTGSHRNSYLPLFIRGTLAGKILSILGAAPFDALGSRLPNHEGLQALAIQTHLELVWCVEGLQRSARITTQLHAEGVFGVFRKGELKTSAPAGPQR